MSKKKKITEALTEYTEKIIESRLEDVLSDRFATYSKYIIQERALPNVKDGLKPVQRRILYGMYKMGMMSDKPYKKSARIVGEVMGKYHPHGDSSIYEAMVRLSQDFKTNMPLVDMHGNNGSVDGDSPAAMRYTEARLTPMAEQLLLDIQKHTVDFIPNFDDEEYEPVVLPARFPNLLVNGSTGISSGYATDVPPHNLTEVMQAVMHRIDDPLCDLESLMSKLPGPDFPTGGIIQGIDGIADAYRTGKGRIVLRAKVEISGSSILIHQLPYDVNKAVLVRKIDEIRAAAKVPGIAEVRDESDREGLRILIETKKDADQDVILNYLFKNTLLQRSYNFNMVAIHNGRPEYMGLTAILDSYILHQKDVITNRSNYDLQKALLRKHIVEGLEAMVDIVDDIIVLIKQSKNKTESKEAIMKKYGFTDDQAEAIVTLQLYRLSNTDIVALRKESKELGTQIHRLEGILSSEELLKTVLKAEIEALLVEFDTPRKSVIEADIETIRLTEEDLIKEEPCVVATTAQGYVKRASTRSYGAVSETEVGLKPDDVLTGVFETTTFATLLVFTTKGNYIYYPVFKLPDVKWKDLGTHISNLVSIDADEQLVHAQVVSAFDPAIDVLITTRKGMIKRTSLQEFNVTRYTKKMKAIKLKAGDHVVSVEIGSEPAIAVTTKHGMLSVFMTYEVPQSGIVTSGVTAIKSKHKQDACVGGHFIKEDSDLYAFTSRGHVIRADSATFEPKGRLRVPYQLTSSIKSNPHELLNSFVLLKSRYLAHDRITIEADSPLILDLFDIKYTTSDNGKKIVQEAQSNFIKLWPVERATSFVAKDLGTPPVTLPSPPEPKDVAKEEGQTIDQIRLEFDETEE
jgi:topoisomerase IV subunit A